ncbi:hypothetical protein AK51_31805 [Serratia nematodiphila DZ0503SBS1]|nr:hypothetical protein AK51_31805 [Serratia nematodiphila DZ0503SBS1]
MVERTGPDGAVAGLCKRCGAGGWACAGAAGGDGGGDWIATSLPERCQAWAPHVRFCSAGGATEAAIFTMLYEVPRGEKIRSVSIPYGKPLPHQRCYILDAGRRPAAPGVRGEIYLAGEGLARGYYGDPQRTAESFFWHEELQERVYRTGDAAGGSRTAMWSFWGVSISRSS